MLVYLVFAVSNGDDWFVEKSKKTFFIVYRIHLNDCSCKGVTINWLISKGIDLISVVDYSINEDS